MKKFIILVSVIAVMIVAGDVMYYRLGFYIDLHPNAPITTFTTTTGKEIRLDSGGGMKKFEIRGVNLGVSTPGKWATDYAIKKETYLRWFQYIKEMGANTIRVYTIHPDDFYNALYEYNKNNDHPLYLIQGVWVDDYMQNSHYDVYDSIFINKFIKDCRNVVDVIHGNKKLSLNHSLEDNLYLKDISPWVIGYILGVEWNETTVAYTDSAYSNKNNYAGKYLYTTKDASPFEAMLTHVGDEIISYESKRYKVQRLIAFSNWAATDPFQYSDKISEYFLKCSYIDVEHIKTTGAFISGSFASYHVYPYYPDYLKYEKDVSGFVDKEGKLNTYYAYLKMLNEHHTIPVIISEFGLPSSRGKTQIDTYTGRDQGNLSEDEQGQALVSCYQDIMDAGCAGCIVFMWQDEWFKKTWNTMNAIDSLNTPYWSDYQSNEQYFGLLSFDPGKTKSVCYTDGDTGEWNEKDLVSENNGMAVSMKYDEKFIYFLIHKDGYNPDSDVLYLPIDTTQKTGSKYCENHNINFERASDFLIVIDGKENSRVLVQERYDCLKAMFFHITDTLDAYENPPNVDSPVFKNINLLLQLVTPPETKDKPDISAAYETGKLTYGDANPEHQDYNSLADYCINGNDIEIKLPWLLLNFANPSSMMIHDDYYENCGVEYLHIREMFVGIGTKSASDVRIPMNSFALKGWGKKVTYHERLKSSYYALQKIWAE